MSEEATYAKIPRPLPDFETEAISNSVATGCHVISSLELHDGDTLILAQLGSGKFSTETLDSLPANLQIIDLDFSKFDKEESLAMEEPPLWYAHGHSPICKISSRSGDKRVTQVEFDEFIGKLDDFIVSKPQGSIKCFFDLGEYRIKYQRARPSTSSNAARPKTSAEWRRTYSASWSSNARRTYSIEWDELDKLISEYLSSGEPVLFSYADKWDALLYVLLASHISGSGAAATIVPENYLSDPTYTQARSSFLHQGLVKRVTYLSKTSYIQDQQALVTTSKMPVDYVQFANDLAGEWTASGLESGIQPTLSELNRYGISAITSHIPAEYISNDGQGRFLKSSYKEVIPTRTILGNDSRLGYESSRFYVLTKKKGRPLASIVIRVSPLTKKTLEETGAYKDDPHLEDLFSGDEGMNEGPGSYCLAVGTSSFDGIGGIRERGGLYNGESPNVYGSFLGFIPPEKFLLKAYDLLISRVNRTPSDRRSLYERPQAEPRLTLVPSMAAEKNLLVCSTSSLCLRSMANDYVHSLALYYYFSKGAGSELLSALATQNPSLTWGQLLSLEVSPALYPYSPEWKKFREKFCDQAQRVIDLQGERDELLERLDAEERAAVELASQL